MASDSSNTTPFWEVGCGDSTIRLHRAAVFLFDFIRTEQDKRTTTFATMMMEEIDDEYLRLLIARMITFCSTNVVPANAKIVDGELVPRNEANTNILTGERLVQYIGIMIQLLRKRFPEHPDFKALDPSQSNAVPDWWTAVRASAITAIKKYHKHLGGNYTFGQRKCRHIYPDNLNCEVGKALVDVWANIDLKGIGSFGAGRDRDHDAPKNCWPSDHGVWEPRQPQNGERGGSRKDHPNHAHAGTAPLGTKVERYCEQSARTEVAAKLQAHFAGIAIPSRVALEEETTEGKERRGS
mmetsp:Transcript_24820/g.56183  ORF Transcript_24820/g.56183 Transcript_24820/m.56183 type:complete len:296 (-) Transcript_24820:574-1461(-)